MSVHESEIAAEQRYVDVVYERLDASSDMARKLMAEGMAHSHIGHEGGLVERDAMVYQATRRMTMLDAAYDGLVFGRLTLVDGEDRYIGRIGVRNDVRDILLVDWRAPAASVFYQATAQDPAGVVRRRVLRSAGSRIVGVEDELLDADRAPEDLVIVGEGALLASLSRARDHMMHSVVATIQKEQDDAIRAPVRGVTLISGGPGTGKTVVALHRAAFLLYSDRRRFEAGGVLVVGPSSVFMNYIERVLPSLGETTVTLRSMGEVVDGIAATEHDLPQVAALKGSGRMAALLQRLVRAPRPDAPTRFVWFYRDDSLVLEAADLARLRRQLHSWGHPNRVSPRAAKVVADALWEQVRGERALDRGPEAFADDLATDAAFVDFIEGWWPELDAIDVWRSIPARLGELASDLFTSFEQQVMRRDWSAEAPRIEDVPLIDELRHLLGEVPPQREEHDDDPRQLMSFERRERDDRDEKWRATASIDDDSYAHVLVDEAQDLSPMQWRMLGRRGRAASWTIVGDAAQSSWPDVAEAVAARDEALGAKTQHHFRLSKNYRNSAEVYELAARVARRTVANPDLAEPVRRTGHDPEHHVGTLADVPAAITELLAAVDGTIAVVPPTEDVAAATEVMADVCREHPRVRVVSPLDTKGLEFDAVVVLDPDAIVAESSAGWRTLYVVLTRATQRLVTIGVTSRWREALDD